LLIVRLIAIISSLDFVIVNDLGVEIFRTWPLFILLKDTILPRAAIWI